MSMTDSELDHVYTLLCQTMTAAGETRSPLLLARFALLAMDTIGDAGVIEKLIEDAAAGLPADRFVATL